MTSYPTTESIRDRKAAYRWIPSLPSLLRTFLDNLICPEVKKVALGHSIVQAVRPKTVLSPILFGVGVSVDHVFASKWLTQLLNRLGCSVSYDEVSRYKQCIIQCESVDMPDSFPDSFTQFAADNVDHDVCTLDGLNTLHAMGIISMSTPKQAPDGHFTEIAIARVKRRKAADVVASKLIPITYCNLPQESFLSTVCFKPSLQALFDPAPDSLRTVLCVNLLHDTAWCSSNDDNLHPSWAGFMTETVKGTPLPSADIRMLPIIDLNLNDLSCIFPTLSFVTCQADKLNIDTCCITFGQPL
jgi:hypothetical protein